MTKYNRFMISYVHDGSVCVHDDFGNLVHPGWDALFQLIMFLLSDNELHL